MCVQTRFRSFIPVLMVALLPMLQACGGGSSGGSGNPASSASAGSSISSASSVSSTGSSSDSSSEASSSAASSSSQASNTRVEVRVEVLTAGLANPWGLALMPDDRILITEKQGRLRIYDPGTQQLSVPVSGLPEVAVVGQGGLLDVILHPDFASNRLVYLSYSAGSNNQFGTEIGRGRLVEGSLQDFERLFAVVPKVGGGQHFGSRMAFDRQGYLYAGFGDRGQMHLAQELDSHIGTVVRLYDDGRIPSDNPFVGQPGALPEIFSYGHRNIQGMAPNPWTGDIWATEHGPQGGDEVNVLESGANYGWPVITYGVNYGSGEPIGQGTHREGMEQPRYYWVPASIAPSGMDFYDNPAIPQWHGDLLYGALAQQFVGKLDIAGNGSLSGEQRVLQDYGRIRAVKVGSRGDIFVITDENPGRLLRLTLELVPDQ